MTRQLNRDDRESITKIRSIINDHTLTDLQRMTAVSTLCSIAQGFAPDTNAFTKKLEVYSVVLAKLKRMMSYLDSLDKNSVSYREVHKLINPVFTEVHKLEDQLKSESFTILGNISDDDGATDGLDQLLKGLTPNGNVTPTPRTDA